MATYNFQSYPYSAQAKFDCPECGKKNRIRSFRAECTLNPFNKDESGNVRGPGEVMAQSRAYAFAKRDEFMKRPICLSCENKLSYVERNVLREIRRSST